MNKYTYSHVLIIDHIQSDILALKKILNSLNYAETISEFGNPIFAFEFLGKCEKLPEVVFISLNMPEMNGFTFIENCVEEFSHEIKFIIVSSSNSPSDIKKSSGYTNIIHYFIKPIDKMDLELIELD